MTTSNDEQGVAAGNNPDEERRIELARLAELDRLTADDEEEIGRFRAFMTAPAEPTQPRATSWLRHRRRPAPL
jgi:hypothetical protein